MSDLLKEAIADAKAVRETALANAKMALEEAFTPQLQSMLSAKLREDEDEEMEEQDDEEIEEQDDEDLEEAGDEEELEAQDEFPGDEEELTAQDVVPGDEEELTAQDVVPGEEEMEEQDDEEMEEDEDELDLEAIIRELESEIDEDDDEDIEEQDDAYDQNVENKKNSAVHEQNDDDEVEEDEEYEVDESIFNEDDDEDIEEQDDAYDQNVENKKNSGVHEQLKEYKAAVLFLKDKLHEVNLLNAKLLFTNKLFKEFALSTNQKMQVVETFDRAQTTREIKLVYSTLAESYGNNAVKRKSRIKESASSKTGSTRPSKDSRKVITEEAQVADRFKKLAGLI